MRTSRAYAEENINRQDVAAKPDSRRGWESKPYGSGFSPFETETPNIVIFLRSFVTRIR